MMLANAAASSSNRPSAAATVIAMPRKMTRRRLADQTAATAQSATYVEASAAPNAGSVRRIAHGSGRWPSHTVAAHASAAPPTQPSVALGLVIDDRSLIDPQRSRGPGSSE